jgi:hypothetical protein
MSDAGVRKTSDSAIKRSGRSSEAGNQAKRAIKRSGQSSEAGNQVKRAIK